MNPFFFGTEDLPLFGVYHPPLTRADRETGVVLCNPFGSEYIHSHRALRQFAIRLARVGFHVLRFDYYACGDSGGKTEEGCLDQWEGDISAAIEELKQRAGLSKVSLAGLRLGATLALFAASRRRDVESLLLWEPITDGKEYLRELVQHQEFWLQKQLFPELRLSILTEGPPQVIGFPLTDAVRRGIESLDFSSMERCPARQVLVVRSSKGRDDQPLLTTLRNLGASPQYLDSLSQSLWFERESIEHIAVPHELLEVLTGWMAENHR